MKYTLDIQTLDCASAGIDVMEVCGGEGRPSYVAVRRQLLVGENIDLIAGWGTNDPAQQHAVVEYVQRHRPLLMIMGPSRTPWGTWRHLNRVINPDAYLRAVRQARPHGLFCAELGWLQLDASRFFGLSKDGTPRCSPLDDGQNYLRTQ